VRKRTIPQSIVILDEFPCPELGGGGGARGGKNTLTRIERRGKCVFRRNQEKPRIQSYGGRQIYTSGKRGGVKRKKKRELMRGGGFTCKGDSQKNLDPLKPSRKSSETKMQRPAVEAKSGCAFQPNTPAPQGQNLLSMGQEIGGGGVATRRTL